MSASQRLLAADFRMNSAAPIALKPQSGIWTLTAPDGQTWTGDSPLQACGNEQRQRIPATIALERIFKAVDTVPAFNFVQHLQRQAKWSEKTFGPGNRTEGVVDHIRKELNEVLANPSDLTEWIDVVILALDGAWSMGASPEQIIAALVAKQTKNEGRQWPDWRTAAPGKAIEHIKAAPEAAA